MLSYRHDFHAGNHADIFKHSVLCLVLEYYKQKSKPFIYIDTHSGSGRYDLTAEQAVKTSEFNGGVGRIIDKNTPQLLQPYLTLVHDFWQQQSYPGSPEIAVRSLREMDKMIFIERHNTVIETLRYHYYRDPRVAVHHRDGYEALPALVPPEIKRGVVLMDPAYELNGDYLAAVKAIESAHKKWSTGCFILWYPLLGKQKDQHSTMKQLFSKGDYKSVFIASLAVEPQAEERGMHGSAMVVINPPWQLASQLNDCMAALAALLSPSHGQFELEWLKEPS